LGLLRALREEYRILAELLCLSENARDTPVTFGQMRLSESCETQRRFAIEAAAKE